MKTKLTVYFEKLPSEAKILKELQTDYGFRTSELRQVKILNVKRENFNTTDDKYTAFEVTISAPVKILEEVINRNNTPH
jgi:hypothetical protein